MIHKVRSEERILSHSDKGKRRMENRFRISVKIL
jgi:hypothetical protein